jgi:ell wall binding domain 2 (CWB2)
VPRRTLLLAAGAALALSGCSLSTSNSGGGSGQINSGVSSSSRQALAQLGLPTAATRDTTRVSGTDPVTDAAGVATAIFPASGKPDRPGAVALVDKGQWQAAVAAGVLAGSPLHAPILLSDGDTLPGATSDALSRLKPTGESLAKGAQAILVGDTPPAPSGVKSGAIHGSNPYTIAEAVDRFQTAVSGKPAPDVMVASADQPAWAMPAAAWAARSGDPVLFVKKDSIPAPTKRALTAHSKPNIYVLGTPSQVSTSVEKQLARLGTVVRVKGSGRNAIKDPVTGAVQFARFHQGNFGWNAVQPGRNYSLASTSRPLDAAAAATLGSNGVYAPLLLTNKSGSLPTTLQAYLLDVQPGFENGDPSQGFYNRVWILGNRDAVSTGVQAKIDQLTELVPVDQPTGK